jgi:hypothetical protein
VAFADVVPVPFRNGYGNIALNDGLTSEAGMELVIGRLFHAVEFIVLHLGQVGVAFLDYNVAGCASTASATCMFEMEPEVHRDIQQRFRFAMSFIRQFTRFELERLTCWKECNSRHFRDYSGPSPKTVFTGFSWVGLSSG